jgi:hypothetical protein
MSWFRRAPKYDPQQPIVGIRRFMVDQGAIDIDLDVQPELVARLYASLALMVSKAPNYTETSLTICPKGEVEEYTVTVQRSWGKTPHQLRMDAEAEVARLRALLDERGEVSSDV